MKIIPKLNPAPIVRFLKILFAVLLCGVIIWLVAEIVYVRCFMYHSVMYNSHEEVLELFKNNTDDFDNIVKLLEETDVINELGYRWYLGEENFLQPSGNSLCDPSRQLKNSGFVTKEQLKELVAFFEKSGVDVIDYHSLINEAVYVFGFNSKTHYMYLMYTDSDNDISKEIPSRLYFRGDVSQLSDHWYCVLAD